MNLPDNNGKPLVMGILNVTPDSFSDGGKYAHPDKALKRALEMVREGADIIDVGGESSGPGSQDVSLKDELERVIPVFEKLRKETDVILSVDTCKADVALHALNIGVDMVNDVTALRGDPTMAQALAKYDAPVVIMYSKDPSARTTREPQQYDDVVATVRDFLSDRIEYGVRQGIKKSRFILDPGMGAFVSSDPKYSLQLLNRLDELKDFGLPILVGPSRKSFIPGPIEERLEGSLAACAVAVMNGAGILRVHDVQQTRRVVDMVHAIMHS
ncbi:MAG TPA: dihydropteroate synthase [Candidatus Gracilibacteria bacterium]|nr:dihydropteroate synthase [Candidatus Gracilibacteria bacterium]